jgi:hypothetical protein
LPEPSPKTHLVGFVKKKKSKNLHQEKTHSVSFVKEKFKKLKIKKWWTFVHHIVSHNHEGELITNHGD